MRILPASGGYDNGTLYGFGTDGYYWSTSVITGYRAEAAHFATMKAFTYVKDDINGYKYAVRLFSNN